MFFGTPCTLPENPLWFWYSTALTEPLFASVILLLYLKILYGSGILLSDVSSLLLPEENSKLIFQHTIHPLSAPLQLHSTQCTVHNVQRRK